MVTELETLGRTIKEVQYRHHRAMDARLAAAGTTLAQWDALRAIGRTPGASAHALATATFQSDQAFGTLANRLAAQGLIERIPGRGRRIEHRLTPAGQATLDAGRPHSKAMLERSFAALTEPERATLLALLARVAPPDLASL
ncbi:MarR family winged helix-turn-helix transcriptional regulator [Subtercola sp. YIM 133946]|uniref:MarR family winged helix-turn-helix transcriptional regulator n=1 Tax=Subtercola sp. YIM 133946 TaxID=3118909 RepID=UPI002F9555B9